MARKETSKILLFVFVPCLVLTFIILMHEKNLSIQETFGALIIATIYCIFLIYALTITNKNAKNLSDKIIWIILILFSFGVLIVSLVSPSIGWDTWQVYDMSKYVFSNFGFMDQIRQHILNTHYEMAFPPLFPCLMAFVNMVFDLGVNSSVYLNAIFVLLCFCELSIIFKRLHLEFVGCVTTCLFFMGSLYVSTYAMGLTQTLGYYLLIRLCRIIICEDKYDWHLSLNCGLCCGFLLMNRFDALAIVAVMFFAIPFLMYKKCSTKEILLNITLYCCTVIVICSPWIFYSLHHFDSIFITDNGRRLFNIPDTRPSTFFSESNPALTIKDSFFDWLVAFSGRALDAIKSFAKGMIRYTIVLEMIAACAFFANKTKQTIKDIKIDSKMISVIALILGQEALFIFTGYNDVRYHLPILFLIQLLLIYCFFQCAKSIKWKRPAIVLMSVLAIVSYAKIGYLTNPIKTINEFMTGGGYHKNLVLTEYEKNIKDYLSNDCNTICFYRSETEFDFLKFSAESQISNIISPANLSTENVYEFVDTFDVNYLYSSNEEVVDVFNSKLRLHDTPYQNLYRVEKGGVVK